MLNNYKKITKKYARELLEGKKSFITSIPNIDMFCLESFKYQMSFSFFIEILLDILEQSNALKETPV